MTLENRLKRLEARLEAHLGPPPPPISEQIRIRAYARAFSPQEMALIIRSPLRPSDRNTVLLKDVFGADTPDVVRRLQSAFDEISQKLTGKSYGELLREEAEDQE